jgi:hypothetical protein
VKLFSSLLVALLAASCRQDMHDGPRLEAMEASAFFPDGRSVRPLVPGTVARGRLEEDEQLERGTLDGQLAATFPFPIERADLERGRERFEIFCTPCHDATGSGNGRVVQRGFQRPPSLHEQRLRDVPVGHVFDVITRGLGGMYDLADRIEPVDRWRIAAWVRVLQRSQHGTVADVPADERARLEAEAR